MTRTRTTSPDELQGWFAGRLPDGTISTDPQTLRQSATDSWPLALLRRVRGDDLPEPVAVLFPARTGEVATILAWASETGTAVIARGAATEPPRPMNRMRSVSNEISLPSAPCTVIR